MTKGLVVFMVCSRRQPLRERPVIGFPGAEKRNFRNFPHDVNVVQPGEPGFLNSLIHLCPVQVPSRK